MKLYFERPVIIGFTLTVVVLIVLGWYSYSRTARLVTTSRLLSHQFRLNRYADLVLKSTLDIETGQRGYIITGDEDYLVPFYNSTAPLADYLNQLNSLTKDNALQSKRIDTLTQLINTQHAWITRVIEAHKINFETARSIVTNGEGKNAMDNIRALVKRIQDEEGSIFRRENTVSTSSLQQFQISLVGLAIFIFVTVLILFYLVNKTLKERNVEVAARKQNEAMVTQLNQDLETKVKDRTLKLAQSEKIYRSLSSNIPGSAITILDREERYILAEGDLLEKMGYEKETMPGMRIDEIITVEGYAYYKTLIDRAYGGETILMEKRTLSGIDTLLRIVPLRNDDEDIFAIMFVYIDVTEMKATQLALSDLNETLEKKVIDRTEQLDEANKELEAFSYSVSHDLRSPLRAITGYSQILKEDYNQQLNEEGRTLVASIIRNSKRMGQLIDDLLDFSKFGRKVLAVNEINMNDMVRDVTAELVAMEANRKIKVNQLLLEPAWADYKMVRQVWINLLSNALKYSRNRDLAEIEIGSYYENGDVCYYVQDNGAGFDMHYMHKLFGVFQRLHKANEFEGTGVGLALVKTIIKRHGGHVFAEGKVDAGAKFTFTLPVKKEA